MAATITRAASPCGWPAAARRGGTIYGETDDFSYNIVSDPVHIRDFHATVLHLLGFDHDTAHVPYQGLERTAHRRGARPHCERASGLSRAVPIISRHCDLRSRLSIRALVISIFSSTSWSCAAVSFGGSLRFGLQLCFLPIEFPKYSTLALCSAD